ncbi:MAG: hypothetical protein EXR24_07205 [Ignavibacteria bacterium]|nr:hypothetical protein [Ignavibacteria bacterium]
MNNNTIKFTKGETNLMAKYQLVSDQRDYTATPYLETFNRFSGEAVNLNQFALKLYSKIMNLVKSYESGVHINVSEMDRLRYLFLKLFPKEYMILLD